MATLPSLLASQYSRLFAAHSFNSVNFTRRSSIRHIPAQCNLPSSSPGSSSRGSDRELRLDGGACCALGVAATMMMMGPEVADAAMESAAANVDAWSSLLASEPKNALSLPTWIIHVASVAEWITAMALVWRYGDTPGNSSWKGLSWGMIPLLGGAMCACTWHFFYNAQSLEILVVLQALLTVIGNFTMWIAAFRIYQASQKQPKLPLE